MPTTFTRSKAYCALLDCPSSSLFFTLLSTPEDPSFLRKFRLEWELDDSKLQSRMEGQVFDHVIARPPSFFLALMAGVLVHFESGLLSMTGEEIKIFFRSSHRVDVGELVRIAEQLVVEAEQVGFDGDAYGEEIPGFGRGLALDGMYNLARR
ncbi:hypothetical protein MNV49_000393 [Pseudohyphozyma bogoriensis]|nr:hypothetical protein MNV49_000393 [Pseudohyphozyma bogoriensis]